MFRVWYNNKWLENIPVTEALTFKQEGHYTQRMDLEFTTPPISEKNTGITSNMKKKVSSSSVFLFNLAIVHI
jgi:hypothetical protein